MPNELHLLGAVETGSRMFLPLQRIILFHAAKGVYFPFSPQNSPRRSPMQGRGKVFVNALPLQRIFVLGVGGSD